MILHSTVEWKPIFIEIFITKRTWYHQRTKKKNIWLKNERIKMKILTRFLIRLVL